MWQDSNLGKYIEFKIKVMYMEGYDPLKSGENQPRISKHIQGAKEWELFKRYSNFIDLHEKLGKYYDAEGIKKPYLPPQIPNKNNA